MASLPREIYIQQRKRRHNEDGDAPAFLQIDNDDPISKRRMSGNFVYKRRTPTKQSPLDHSLDPRTPSAELTAPIIRTKPSAANAPAPNRDAEKDPSKDASPDQPAGGLEAAARPISQPRRFHMSRSLMNRQQGNQSPKLGPQGISKKRYTTAVFVERNVKRLQHLDPDSLPRSSDKLQSSADMSDSSTRKKPSAKRLQPKTESKAEAKAIEAPATAAAPVEANRKPLPDITPGVNPDELAAEMDKWVLNEIGLNLKDIKQSTAGSTPKKKTTTKFKPKAPAKRFAERHPELAAHLDAENGHAADADMREVDTEASDDDYEIVVYELAPDDAHGALGSIPPEQIGFLKFDSRQDMDLFYGNEDDDSDWMPEDDEDENAENHYTAEYPEELDSDDSEFDGAAIRGPRGPFDDDSDGDNVAAYYRSGEFEADYADDEDDDKYIIEGDESRDRDDVYQDNIRRYIQRYGGN